jgi:hypothetical protein
MSTQDNRESGQLHDNVVSARGRLRLAEEKHERMLVSGSSTDLAEIGREYAAAERDHSDAVMAWLSWLKRRGHQR